MNAKPDTRNRHNRTCALALVAAVSLLACLFGEARACIWDRDTLAAEAAVMDVTGVIVGRFPRNPPLYYKMRLDRVAQELEHAPDRLDLYDDAAVAADRLGRHDEAIAWMERKAKVLATMDPDDPQSREHRHRYLANLGTFYAHRWIARGRDASDLSDLYRAQELIDEAIQLNPDAHFGRERFQLMAIEWLLNPPVIEGTLLPLTAVSDPELTKRMMYGRIQPADHSEWPQVIEAMSGLIVLGAAWQSVDVYHTLSLALQAEGHSSLALLAQLRAHELIDAGARSLHPEAPRGEELKELAGTQRDLLEYPRPVEESFAEQRQAADAWHQSREAFMLQRLETGMHPDTHDDFWAGFQEPRPPALPGTMAMFPVVSAAIGMAVVAAVLVSAFWLQRRRVSGAA
jgi:tetratricopeptide (TPR) repeat protein